jgi:putative hemolysin
LAVSAAISGSETALFSLNRRALEAFRTSARATHQRVHRIMEHPRRCLLTLLLANTAVNTAIFTVAFVAMEALRDNHPVAFAAAGVGFLLILIIVAEMLPKALALTNVQRLAPIAASIVSALEVVLGPIRWFLAFFLVDPMMRLLAPAGHHDDAVSPEELTQILEQSAQDGVIDKKENEMLMGAVALSTASVREVMTPRVDLQAIPLPSDPATARRLAAAAGRRILVAHARDLDDVKGIIPARDVFLNPTTPVRSLVRPVHFVPEQVNLIQLIRYFREKKIQYAVVVDEYGGTAGFVSLTDVAKRVIGEVSDEPGARPMTVETIDDHTYRLPGDFSVRLWANRFGVREIDGHIDTLAGLVLSKLGRLPRPGDTVRIRNLTLTVEAMEKRRVASVILHRDRLDGHAGAPPS